MKETRRLYLQARGDTTPIPPDRLKLSLYAMQVHLSALAAVEAKRKADHDRERSEQERQEAEKLTSELAALRRGLEAHRG